MKRTISFIVALLLPVLLCITMAYAATAKPLLNITEPANVKLGDTFEVKVKIRNNPGIIAININVAFDEELTLIKAVSGDAFSKLSFIPPKKLSTTGQIKRNCNFIWQAVDIEDKDIKDGTILTLTFKLSDKAKPGNVYSIKITSRNNDVIDKKLNSVSLSAQVKVKVKVDDHTYKNVVTKATLTKNGKIVPTCSVCGATKTATIVYYPKSFKLSDTSYNYDGKAKKPTITVTDTNGKVIANTNYTVSYSNNTAIGTATAKVTFKGNYSGSKSISYKIVLGQVKGLKQTEVTATTMKLSWTNVTDAKYYKVEQSTDGKKWTVISSATTANTITISKLKAGTNYQYRVTALDSTKKNVGKVSAVFKTQTLCSAPTITVTSTKSKIATVSWKKVTGASKYVVYKSTDNKNWTKVTTTATSYNVTKLTSGKKIYIKVQAVNAYDLKSAYSAVKNVTVKK